MAFGDFVQGTGVDAGTVSAAALAFTGATTAGNTLLVAVRMGGANALTGTTCIVTDDSGNTYTQDTAGALQSGTQKLLLFRVSNILGKASQTITVTCSAAVILRFTIAEYSGQFAVHQSNTGSDVTGTATSLTIAIPSTSVTCAIIGAFSTDSSAGMTAGGSFTQRVDIAQRITAIDRGTAQAAGTWTPSANSASATDFLGIGVAYSQAGGSNVPISASQAATLAESTPSIAATTPPILPTPGGDINVWGGELNTWLRVAHDSFGNVQLPIAINTTILAPTGPMAILGPRIRRTNTITAVWAMRDGGSGATINVRRNRSQFILQTDLSLSSAQVWMSGSAIQNALLNDGDTIEFVITSVSGTPTSIEIQIDGVNTGP